MGPQNRVEKDFVVTMRKRLLVKVALDPLPFGRCDVTFSSAICAIATTGQFAFGKMGKRLAQRFRLKHPTNLKTVGEFVGRRGPAYHR